MTDHFKILKKDQQLQETIEKVNQNNQQLKKLVEGDEHIFDFMNFAPNFRDFSQSIRQQSINNFLKKYDVEDYFQIFIGKFSGATFLKPYTKLPFIEFLTNPRILNNILEEHLKEYSDPTITGFNISHNIIGAQEITSKKLNNDFINNHYEKIMNLEIDEVNNYRFNCYEGGENDQYRFYKEIKEYLRAKGVGIPTMGNLHEVFSLLLDEYSKNPSYGDYNDLENLLFSDMKAFALLYDYFMDGGGILKVAEFSLCLNELMKATEVPVTLGGNGEYIFNITNFEYNEGVVRTFINNYDEQMPLEWNVALFFKLTPLKDTV